MTLTNAGAPPTTAHALPVNRGIHAALVLPFDDEGRIDEHAYRRQVDHVLAAPGITGLLVNGHAGENSVTTDAEKERIVRLSRANVPDSLSITSGILAEGSSHAAEQAARMEAAGADALLVFQPFSWALGVEPQAIFTHHRIIHDRVRSPILLYAAPASGRLAYTEEVVSALIALPRVRGIKDGSWEIATSERLAQRVHAARPDVMFMGSGDEHLMLNYFLGTAGSQVSLATPVPGLVCRLWDAAEAGDWTRARDCHARLQPLAWQIYRKAPTTRAVARLKACLKILGVIASDRVRPPLPALPTEEYGELEKALRRCEGPIALAS